MLQANLSMLLLSNLNSKQKGVWLNQRQAHQVVSIIKYTIITIFVMSVLLEAIYEI